MVDTDEFHGSVCSLWFNVKWLNSLSMFPNLFNVSPNGKDADLWDHCAIAVCLCSAK